MVLGSTQTLTEMSTRNLPGLFTKYLSYLNICEIKYMEYSKICILCIITKFCVVGWFCQIGKCGIVHLMGTTPDRYESALNSLRNFW
jgi:hypothetical protein